MSLTDPIRYVSRIRNGQMRSLSSVEIQSSLTKYIKNFKKRRLY